MNLSRVINLLCTACFLLQVFCTKALGIDSVIGVLGGNVLLPCICEPSKRSDLYYLCWQIDKTLVFAITNNTPEYGENFKTRARVSENEIQNGNCSLHLSNISVNDAKNYDCIVAVGDRESKKQSISLKVAANYSEPKLEVINNSMTDGNISVYMCSTYGGYPKGNIYWTLDDEPQPQDSDRIQFNSTNETRNRSYNITSVYTVVNVPHQFRKIQCIVENSALQVNLTASYEESPYPKKLMEEKKKMTIIATVSVSIIIIVTLILAVLGIRHRNKQAGTSVI
ncbi:ICOS ligand-like [Erpetoichthys calabaricus]|uniref:ICOS ligand-like n=1 Tax=Erpetoichthys calabaricus TaxID=27687 RepID=UPI0010A046FB|nr:ICOS ligand-like [Erpetoichthys calabaricus]